MSQMENCYWFTSADYVVWIFNYSIKATGVPLLETCETHGFPWAPPPFISYFLLILAGTVHKIYTIYIYTSFLKEHGLDQRTILSFYLSI